MRILAIRGKNLASLAGEFEVDFQQEPLVSAGLFAICGPTGAGKSTLLDALCLALYGDTPRLKSADARIDVPDVQNAALKSADPRTLLRRGTAEGYAEVDFVGHDGIAYRARWSVRRAHGKSDKKLQATDITFSKLEDGQAVGGHLKTDILPLIAEKVGLSFNQFTRAVLLAQNEFFAFLKANDDERSELLQTLTGTDRFEVLSIRAFERNKREQEALQKLREKLNDQQPLSAENREQKEKERDTLKAEMLALELRKSIVSQQVAWNQDWGKAKLDEANAQAKLQSAQSEREAIADRRTYFTRIEAVQPARFLVGEVDRIDHEHSVALDDKKKKDGYLAQCVQVHEQAQQALTEARSALLSAEHTQTVLAPKIQDARRLDTELETLMPSYGAAQTALEEAHIALQQAKSALVENEQALQRAQAEHQHTQEWCTEHSHVKLFAEGWARWDIFFGEAAEHATNIASLATEIKALNSTVQKQHDTLRVALEDCIAAEKAVDETQALYVTRNEAVQRFDIDAFTQRKTIFEARRNALHEADTLWRELSNQTRQHSELQQEIGQCTEAMQSCQIRLNQIAEAKPVAQACAEQAERSWRIVYEASQANIEALRAQLQPDKPCPVCGSSDHPYVVHSPAMNQAEVTLHALWEDARKKIEALNQDEQVQRAILKDRQETLVGIEIRKIALYQGIEILKARWSTHSIARESLGVAEEGLAAWLSTQLEKIQQEADDLNQQETAYRAAVKVLDEARQILESDRQTLQKSKDVSATIRTELERCTQSLQHKQAAYTSTQNSLEERLCALDAAHAPNEAMRWREQWLFDPLQYQTARRKEVESWLMHVNFLEDIRKQIESLTVTCTNLQQLLDKATNDDQKAENIFKELSIQLQNKGQARKSIFADTAYASLTVDEIEQQLMSAIEQRRAQLEVCQSDLQHAVQQFAQATEACNQLHDRLVSLESSRERAAEKLNGWIAQFNTSIQKETLHLELLRTLLSHDNAWLYAERQSLQQFDTAIERAQAVLVQIESQRATLEKDRPTEEPEDSLRSVLAELSAQLEVHQQTLLERELELRRDTEIKHQAAEYIKAIEVQEHTAKLWAQMNDLIGSSDGKKFRNYAQQMTLDILLAYANLHLKDLARRYRLERIQNSLALMVIDQDMGNECRSVHSLSGGESFLISLGLALGLASLSSHRVRVESLFIDEGFGSLDSDTLRVAMDALDSLQSSGRKVGVISHIQDMTERIGTRIQVKRRPGGQSHISVV